MANDTRRRLAGPTYGLLAKDTYVNTHTKSRYLLPAYSIAPDDPLRPSSSGSAAALPSEAAFHWPHTGMATRSRTSALQPAHSQDKHVPSTIYRKELPQAVIDSRASTSSSSASPQRQSASSTATTRQVARRQQVHEGSTGGSTPRSNGSKAHSHIQKTSSIATSADSRRTSASVRKVAGPAAALPATGTSITERVNGTMTSLQVERKASHKGHAGGGSSPTTTSGSSSNSSTLRGVAFGLGLCSSAAAWDAVQVPFALPSISSCRSASDALELADISVGQGTSGPESSSGSEHRVSAAAAHLAAGTRAQALLRRSLSTAASPLSIRQQPLNSNQAVVGLQNLGNTCFANSILHCLLCLPCFIDCFQAGSPRFVAAAAVDSRDSSTLAGAFAELVQDAMHSPKSAVLSPDRLLLAMEALHDEKWGDGMQQDAQEFLHGLLVQLQGELNRVDGGATGCAIAQLQRQPSISSLSVPKQAAAAWAAARQRQNSCITDIFGGQLQSAVTCGGCGAVSYCFEDFFDLSLPIPPGRTTSIQNCLQAFTDCEALEEDAGFKCGACKRVRPATKRLTVRRCPPVLVLTLKRFSTGAQPAWSFAAVSKNTVRISLQLEGLDMRPYCSGSSEISTTDAGANADTSHSANRQATSDSTQGEDLMAAVRSRGSQTLELPLSSSREEASALKASPPLTLAYDLAAVVHHSGSLDGGHYTARCRHLASGIWHEFNDATVRDVVPVPISASAYILVYKRQVGMHEQ